MQKFSPPLFRYASLCFSPRTIYQNKNKTKQTNRPSKQAADPDDLYYKAKNTKKDPWLVCMFCVLYSCEF